MSPNRKWIKFGLLVTTFIIGILFINERYIKADQKNDTIGNQSPHQTEKKALSVPIKESSQLDVPLLYQFDEPSLYNGCEVTSLAMILNYYDIEVTKNELADEIKTVPLLNEDDEYGNPHKGFVGSISGEEPGLGVYHEPIVKLAQKYVSKNKVIDLTGSDFNEVLAALSSGHPVWTITTATFSPVDDFVTWDTTDGEIDVTYSMHSVAITGYDSEMVYFNDPYGEKDSSMDRDTFEETYEQMGSQAVYFNL
ncbi:C39 family peptidase [Carnobacterium divergens]|uniref:Membrane-associated hydrolase n=1 Tax=Carnobacterium divergens DSM 20623 TaxID=1449336 RepID=A0A0R2HRP1_CARDV|nr:C39 family peptidase [Carnobacterium divergens]KRN54262.1 membrane-associated hydrolase [Carnobacterium divergens DSM 20623]MDO0873749.1 C39 family peptidase [Carnobacterium divergens]SUX19141.1 Uncharacterized protein conserved in bacteria [Carnobacterium divergens]